MTEACRESLLGKAIDVGSLSAASADRSLSQRCQLVLASDLRGSEGRTIQQQHFPGLPPEADLD